MGRDDDSDAEGRGTSDQGSTEEKEKKGGFHVSSPLMQVATLGELMPCIETIPPL